MFSCLVKVDQNTKNGMNPIFNDSKFMRTLTSVVGEEIYFPNARRIFHNNSLLFVELTNGSSNEN